MKENSGFKVGDKVWFYEKDTSFWDGYTNGVFHGFIEVLDVSMKKAAIAYKEKKTGKDVHTVVSLDKTAPTRQSLWKRKREEESFQVGDLVFAVLRTESSNWRELETETHMGPVIKVTKSYIKIQLLEKEMSFYDKNNLILFSRSGVDGSGSPQV